MSDESLRKLNELLENFIHAPEHEADSALTLLYERGIQPTASTILRSKLHVSLQSTDERYINQIGLELLSDVRVGLMPILRQARSDAETELIGNFKAYITTTTLNVYRQYLREKYPNRLRLRNKIRYIMTTGPEYAIWKENDIWVCGLKSWENLGKKAVDPSDLKGLGEAVSLDTGAHCGLDDNARILDLITAIFAQSTSPISLEYTISMIWDALGLTEQKLLSGQDEVFDVVPAKAMSVEEHLDLRLSLQGIWDELCRMPLRHRRALLLNLTDRNRDNLIAFFPALGIASIRRIAEVLEYEPGQFAQLWTELPLDDLSIAELMGLTRQQVINLRQSARFALRRRRP